MTHRCSHKSDILEKQKNEGIGVQEQKYCLLCGNEGVFLYRALRDRLFEAPGTWSLMRCPNCDLIWLNPQPLPEDLYKLYESYFTHEAPQTAHVSHAWLRRAYSIVKEGYLAVKYGYGNALIPFWKKCCSIFMVLDPGRRADLDCSVMYLRARPNGRLLDVGCGNGELVKRMQDLGWTVEGVDFDPIAVENLQKEGLPVRLGTLEAQQYPDNHFDAITMSHLIEHVHNPLQLLRECRRILNPSGRLVVTTPNSKSLGHRMFKYHWLALDPPRHLHIFTALTLRGLGEKAGFLKPKVFTTIRNANDILIASQSIRNTGKYVWGSLPLRRTRIWARAMQFMEWVILKVKPDMGEEIAFVADK